MKFYAAIVVLSLFGTALSHPVENDATEQESDDLVVSTTLSPEHNAHLHDNEDWKPLPKESLNHAIQCENGSLGLSMEFMKEVKHCNMKDSQLFGEEEGMKHPNCAYFCQATATHVLGEDGLPNKALYDEFIAVAFPESHQEKVKEEVGKCIEELGAGVDSKDTKCEGAGAFNKCIHKLFDMEC